MFEIMFFGNGNTSYFEKEKQMPKLQTSWLLLYVDFLEKQGVNPLDGVYIMPDGKKATIFKTREGYNWEFKT